MPSLVHRAIAEIYGTFALVFFGCGIVVMDSFPGARVGLMSIALVHALVVSVAVSSTIYISGAHFNPAVTLGMLSVRRIPAFDAVVYIAAQLAGALLGAFAVTALLPGAVGRLVAWGTPLINSAVTMKSAIAIEALLTFFLMSAVMGTAGTSRAPRIGGFGIGLTLFFAIMVGGPLTGAALNPARAFGPAVMSGTWAAQVVFWIGPIVGAVVAALLWHHVLLRDDGAVTEEVIV
ncbi:MAG: aquaporin [Gemmatimonadales bacterium]|nr:aquaporin [Gemmatimonadales bacterium]